jgi:hypothetical protein
MGDMGFLERLRFGLAGTFGAGSDDGRVELAARSGALAAWEPVRTPRAEADERTAGPVQAGPVPVALAPDLEQALDAPFEWEAPVFDVRAGVPSAPRPGASGAAGPVAPAKASHPSAASGDASTAENPSAEGILTLEPSARKRSDLHGNAAAHGHPNRATEPPSGAKSSAQPPVPDIGDDLLRQRIRARYLAVRFPGVPAGTSACDASGYIKIARLYFEDGDFERANELLQYLNEALPGEERPWLARLEVLFLCSDAAAFVEVARGFRERFPHSAAWGELARLGFRLAPKEMLFAAGRPEGQSLDEHYGAWPEAPNWIEAPWDLTGEVLAVELRGRILGTAGPVSKRVH